MEASAGQPDSGATRLRRRLADRLPVLLAAAAVLLVVAGLGRLQPLEALAAFVPLVLAALLVPRPRAAAASRPQSESAAGDPVEDVTVGLFADSLPDPCILIDRRSLVIHRNGRAAQHFPGVTVGDPLAFSLRAPALLGAIEAARRTGASQTVELHQTVPAETWYMVSIAPLGESAGAGAGRLVIVMHDLTEERRLAAMRTDFVANASHELRTPLTSLLGFIDTLLGPAADDAAARTRFLGIMRTQAARMSKLIDDLLSLSRIEMRQHVRPTGEADVAALLREVSEGLQVQAGAAGVEVALSLPEEPAIVAGDRHELHEVFENLLDNAIKYGSDGGRVEVSLSAVSDRPGFAYRVSVVDHGAGIEPEHVPRLTERFYRVDAESSRRKKGTGLGLAIVKHIVSRHRGTLSISSRPGEGTRVDVLLAR